MKSGDLVRFKVSALSTDHTEWVKRCAKNRVPMLILFEYNSDMSMSLAARYFGSSSILSKKCFEVMCEGDTFHAFEHELSLKGFSAQGRE